jgi:hypothetical protein
LLASALTKIQRFCNTSGEGAMLSDEEMPRVVVSLNPTAKCDECR